MLQSFRQFCGRGGLSQLCDDPPGSLLQFNTGYYLTINDRNNLVDQFGRGGRSDQKSQDDRSDQR